MQKLYGYLVGLEEGFCRSDEVCEPEAADGHLMGRGHLVGA